MTFDAYLVRRLLAGVLVIIAFDVLYRVIDPRVRLT